MKKPIPKENPKPSFDQLPEDVRQNRIQLEELKHILLNALSSKTEEPDIPNMNVQSAADFLLLKVPTIYSKVSKGELPAMKRGNRLYFSRKDLIAYLKEGRRMTNNEVDALADSYLAKSKKSSANSNAKTTDS